jgi:hypothetical protein
VASAKTANPKNKLRRTTSANRVPYTPISSAKKSLALEIQLAKEDHGIQDRDIQVTRYDSCFALTQVDKSQASIRCAVEGWTPSIACG